MDSPGWKGDSSLLEEVEIKRQELYKAQMNIKILTANVEHLEFENTELKNALAEEMQKCKDSVCDDQIASDLKYQRQISELTQYLEEVQASEKMARVELKRLEQQLQHALATTSAVLPQTGDDEEEEDEVAALHLRITKLESENNSLKCKLLETALDLQKKIDENTGLHYEITEKDEELEGMGIQFSSQCDISERLREENQELKAQFETETGQVDTRRKGNSLFSEVDDRRVVAENKLIKLEQLMKNLEEKLTKEQKENKRLKVASKGCDEDVVRNLHHELEDSKRKVIQLNEQLLKREPVVKQQKQALESELPTPGNTSDQVKMFINYLQGMITQKKKEVEEAKAEAQQTHMQLLRTDLHLTEANNKIMSLSRERDQLRVMNSHLSMSVREMQHKYEPELFAPAYKNKITIPVSKTDLFPAAIGDKQQTNVLTPNPHRDGASDNTSSRHKNTLASVKSLIEDLSQNMKENRPVESPVDLSRDGKSTVQVMPQKSVLSAASTNKQETQVKVDEHGGKLKKTGKRSIKYQSVTCSDADAEVVECKQQ